MDIIKKFWKYIAGLVVVLFVSGIVISYVTASNEPIIALNGPESHSLASDQIENLSATVTIPNFTGDVDALIATNLVWETENNQVVMLSKNFDTDVASEKVIGNNIQAKALKAGRTNVSVKFYYKLDSDGNITADAYSDGASGFEVTEVKYSSFTCLFVATFDPEDAYSKDRVYLPGEQLTFRGNTYTADPVTVTSSNNVAEGIVVSNSEGKINVKMGGKAIVCIRTESGYVGESNTYLDELCKYITIVGACRFNDTRIDSSNNTYEILPSSYGIVRIESNIDTSDNSGVTYESTDPTVATMDKSAVTPLGAGYTTITAGVKNDDGSYMQYENALGTIVKSSDSVRVLVPFVWMNNGTATENMVQTLNVGDFLQLSTNKTESSVVTYTSSNTSVATVNESGYVTTKSSGTTIITAHVTNGDYEKSITATINVGDIFSLNAAEVSIGVNETYDISAVGTASGATITFTIDGVDAASASGGLTGEVNSNVLTVKGVSEGTYTVAARMEYNGMIKSATCKVTVKTQVTDVTISPTTLNMNVGDTANLTVTVGPNSAYNKNVVWVSSDSEVVSVDTANATAYGAIITAKKGGIATITVVSVSDGTKYATCTVNVREAVTGIELNETNVTVNMNIIPEYVLIAKVLPENTTGLSDGVNRNVIWSSTDESVLTVSNNGKVTFVAPGSAAVVAKTEDGGFTAYCNFTVSVPVEEIRITSEDLILNVGDEVALTAEVLPLTASNRTVKWSTTDTNVITIDSNGTLKAVNAGHAAVFCRSLDNGAEDYINVYVRQPVSNITLNTNSITVTKGTEFWLYATVLPEDADIKLVDWSSSDTSLATVGDDGKVTALMPGVVTITATSRDTGDSDYCVVTITEAVTSISLLTGDSQTLFVGSQFTIVPEVLPVDALNKSVTYKSSNEEIATVDANGVVTAVKGGECDIIVTTVERQLTALCHITVIEYLSTITLDRTFTYINIGSYTDLVATTTTDTATNKTILWKTANSGIATVDDNGRVTAVAYGTTVITAEAADGGGARATCVVQVVEPVTSISVNPTELHLLAGDTYMLNTTVSPANATVKLLSWSSSNETVATVDADGEITAVAGGKCRIIATSTDGNNVTAYCTVYVTNRSNATKLTLNSSDIKIKIGETRKLTVRTTPENITEQLAWYSTDTGKVTVDQQGNITGRAEGEANVVVYGVTSGVEAICKVTVESSVNKATSVKINSTEITMLSGKTRQLTAVIYPLDSTEKLLWYSTDTSVVVVDDKGKITTVGPGRASVIAYTGTTNLEATCVVNSLAISKSSLTMQQYDPITLYVDGAPSGSKVSWRTGNPRIATVSSTGQVIGRKPGTTTITATVDNKTLTCTVTITEATKY